MLFVAVRAVRAVCAVRAVRAVRSVRIVRAVAWCVVPFGFVVDFCSRVRNLPGWLRIRKAESCAHRGHPLFEVTPHHNLLLLRLEGEVNGSQGQRDQF